MGRVQSLGVIFGALAVLALGYIAYDWRFWLRHIQSPPDDRIIFDFNWYTPRVQIGAGDGQPIAEATADEKAAVQPALDRVLAYAKAMDSYAVLIAHDGKLLAEYYKDGFGPASLFDTQSMHKGLLAIAFGAAVDAGAIPTIDAPAAAYLPEWRDDERRAIAIRDLLANVSGLKEYQFSEAPWSPAYRMFIGTNLDALALGIPADAPPRTAFLFNHANSQVLHAVLTRATGQSYPDFIRTRLWEPLGNGAAQVRLDEPGGAARTVCCFQTQARSWLRLANMLLDGGKANGVQVISPAWIAAATTPTALHPKSGFHVQIGGRDAPPRDGGSARAQPTRTSEPLAAQDVFYLEGRGGQRTLWIPSHRIAVVRIGKIDFKWDDAKVVNPLVAAFPTLN